LLIYIILFALFLYLFNNPHCFAIRSAIPGKVLLLSFHFQKLVAIHLLIFFQLLKVTNSHLSTISVEIKFGKFLVHKQVVF
jgi:hypothetical protein